MTAPANVVATAAFASLVLRQGLSEPVAAAVAAVLAAAFLFATWGPRRWTRTWSSWRAPLVLAAAVLPGATEPFVPIAPVAAGLAIAVGVLAVLPPQVRAPPLAGAEGRGAPRVEPTLLFLAFLLVASVPALLLRFDNPVDRLHEAHMGGAWMAAAAAVLAVTVAWSLVANLRRARQA